MTGAQTAEVLESTDRATALRFHLGTRHFPPVHPDFDEPVLHAIDEANLGHWDSTVLLPNGRVLTVASIVEQLHLDPFLEQTDPWAPLD